MGNGWIKIFSPWFEFADSVLTVSPGQIVDIKATLTEREKTGIQLYGWTWGQIAWRRFTIAQKCGGNEDLFDQEYPEDEQSAFLTSGRPRFSARGMTRLREMAGTKSPKTGFLHLQDGDVVTWEESESGWAQIFEEPKEDCSYLLWCDTATGREQSKDAKDPDRHSIWVLRKGYEDHHHDIHNHMAVARVRPPCFDDWHILEEKVAALCLYYGKCLIGVEVPMGLTLLEGLRRRGLPLFKRKSLNSTSGTDGKLGWQSNSVTKPLVVASLAKATDDSVLDLYCPHAVAEMNSFVVHEDGSEAALSGKHDDDVMSLAMGIHNIRSATNFRKQIVKAKLPADFNKWKPLHR